jgi:very-short-patch-repair endonuclease
MVYNSKNTGIRKPLNILINEFNIVHHNKYDYSLVEYINNKTKVNIICPIHGIFKQTPSHHLKGHGCSKCTNNYNYSTDEYIKEAYEKHGNKYDYSLVEYINNKTNIIIICKIHGNFKQIPSHHLNGCGCPICNLSKGEKEIKKFLDDNNIKYVNQKIFEDCKYERSLPFDFYLIDYNICIEFDGEQHYKINEFFGGENGLNIRNRNDKIKTEYCFNNNIHLLRIKYNDNIKKILTNKFKKNEID